MRLTMRKYVKYWEKWHYYYVGWELLGHSRFEISTIVACRIAANMILICCLNVYSYSWVARTTLVSHQKTFETSRNYFFYQYLGRRPDIWVYIVLETNKCHFLQNAGPDFDETFLECLFDPTFQYLRVKLIPCAAPNSLFFSSIFL